MAVFVNGITVTTNISQDILHFSVALPEEYNSLVRGLLGDYNGNSTDDFKSPTDTVTIPSNENVLFYFVESCQLPLTRNL